VKGKGLGRGRKEPYPKGGRNARGNRQNPTWMVCENAEFYPRERLDGV
jgi:hypothetical protein